MSLTLLTALFVTGCGTVTSGDNKEASGSAVSGSAVSDTKTSEDSVKAASSGFGNSTNYYFLLSDLGEETDEDGIVQFKNDGTRVGVVEVKDILHILYVDDTGVYYVNEKRTGKEQLCYLPVIKEAGEDKPLDKKREEILLEEDWEASNNFSYTAFGDLKVDSGYIFYTNPKNEYVRYNRETKKKTKEAPFGKVRGEDDYVRILGLFQNSIYLAYTNYKTMVMKKQSLDTLKWETVYEGNFTDALEEEGTNYIQNGENVFYFVDDGKYSIRGYNFRTNKEELLCTEEDIEKELEKAGLMRESIWKIGMFCGPENRLYLQLQIDEKRKSIYETRNVIFSIGMEDKTLVYEKELCEAIWKGGVYAKGTMKYDYEDTSTAYKENPGRCIAIVGNRAYIIMKKSKNKIQFAYYDLSSGEFKKFDRKSKEFLDMQRDVYAWTYHYYMDDGDFSMDYYPNKADINITEWKYEQ